MAASITLLIVGALVAAAAAAAAAPESELERAPAPDVTAHEGAADYTVSPPLISGGANDHDDDHDSLSCRPLDGHELELEQADELESQLALEPSDAEETEHLRGPELALADFCVGARDLVLASMRGSLADLRGRMLRVFFGAFSGRQLDADQVRQELLAGANQQDTHVTTTTPAPAQDSAGQPQQAELERRWPGQVVLDIIMVAVNAIRNSLGQAIKHQLQLLRCRFGWGQLREAAAGTCKRIQRLRGTLEARLRRAAAAGGEPGRLDQVKCVTVRRLLNLAGVCEFGSRVAQHPLFSLLSAGHQVSKLMKPL